MSVISILATALVFSFIVLVIFYACWLIRGALAWNYHRTVIMPAARNWNEVCGRFGLIPPRGLTMSDAAFGHYLRFHFPYEFHGLGERP